MRYFAIICLSLLSFQNMVQEITNVEAAAKVIKSIKVLKSNFYPTEKVTVLLFKVFEILIWICMHLSFGIWAFLFTHFANEICVLFWPSEYVCVCMCLIAKDEE